MTEMNVEQVVLTRFLYIFLFFCVCIHQQHCCNGSIVLPLTDFQVSKDVVEPYVHGLVEKFNCMVSSYVEILMCKDFLKTIRFIVIVQIVCMIGKRVEGLNSAYALLNILFVIPLIYEWQQEKIDGACAKAWKQVKAFIDQGTDKVPPNIRQQITSTIEKIQGGIMEKKNQ